MGFKQFVSRIGAALNLATPAEKKAIAEELRAAIDKPAADALDEFDAANKIPGYSPTPAAVPEHMVRRRNNIGNRSRSIRKGTQSRFHAKRGYANQASVNHALATNKALHYIRNPLLGKLLGQHIQLDEVKA